MLIGLNINSASEYITCESEESLDNRDGRGGASEYTDETLSSLWKLLDADPTAVT